MADFGKLNFSTSFNPTSAFPLDARCYFDSLALAKAAAATAEEVGSTNTVYYIGQKLLVRDLANGTSTWYKITPQKTLEAEGSGSSGIAADVVGETLVLNPSTSSGSNETGMTITRTDETLTCDENGVLSVNTTDVVEANNTLPITSAAVHTQIGNIDVLLQNI